MSDLDPPLEDDAPSSTSALPWPVVTRRSFMASAGAAAASLAVPLAAQAEAVPVAADVAAAQAASPLAVPVALTVNGQLYKLTLEPRVTLLDALREVIGLSGSKKGCDRGQCGACTVLVDQRRINACLSLAVMCQGTSITTIEGLAKNNSLHPMQAAFLHHDGFQCGYCTPGQICSAVGAVDEMRRGDPSAATADVRVPLASLDAAEIRERMSGNICRCGAYPNIVNAVAQVLSDVGSA